MAHERPSSDIGRAFAEMPLFVDLPGKVLDDLATRAHRRELRSGELLYAEGDPPEYFYAVVSGRLRVSSGGSLVGYVGRMDPVGEMGLVAGEAHSSSVHAIRDSIVLGVPREDFLDFAARHPTVLTTLTGLAIKRLRHQGHQRIPAANEIQGTFAVIPASPGVPAPDLAETLVRRLGGWPHARLITAAHVDATLGEGAAQTPLTDEAGSARLTAWLNELEGRHRYLILAADSDRDSWALRCLHNADRVLVLAEAHVEPGPVPVLRTLRSSGAPSAPVELVLLRAEGDPSPHVLAWREETGARAHYFVHPWDEGDLASLARQVTGRGVGLVLGGGGARGFAHIGLLRALEQLKIPVDIVGGTSMGAFVGALVACGFDSVEITDVARETFVRNNYLNDYALPRVSLIRGQKSFARLREVFGDRRIEELRRTYFCVSTNLTTGTAVVQDHGPLSVWVGTSMAVPGILPPIAYEGDLLCDGGLVDNLPTGPMQRLERGSIIACNVGADNAIRAQGAGVGDPDPDALLLGRGSGPLPLLNEILIRSVMLSTITSAERSGEYADIYMRMPLQDYTMFDWRHMDQLIEIGYQYALKQLAPLVDTLTH